MVNKIKIILFTLFHENQIQLREVMIPFIHRMRHLNPNYSICNVLHQNIVVVNNNTHPSGSMHNVAKDEASQREGITDYSSF